MPELSDAEIVKTVSSEVLGENVKLLKCSKQNLHYLGSGSIIILSLSISTAAYCRHDRWLIKISGWLAIMYFVNQMD